MKKFSELSKKERQKLIEKIQSEIYQIAIKHRVWKLSELTKILKNKYQIDINYNILRTKLFSKDDLSLKNIKKAVFKYYYENYSKDVNELSKYLNISNSIVVYFANLMRLTLENKSKEKHRQKAREYMNQLMEKKRKEKLNKLKNKTKINKISLSCAKYTLNNNNFYIFNILDVFKALNGVDVNICKKHIGIVLWVLDNIEKGRFLLPKRYKIKDISHYLNINHAVFYKIYDDLNHNDIIRDLLYIETILLKYYGKKVSLRIISEILNTSLRFFMYSYPKYRGYEMETLSSVKNISKNTVIKNNIERLRNKIIKKIHPIEYEVLKKQLNAINFTCEDSKKTED